MIDTACSSAHNLLRKRTASWHSRLDRLPALRVLMRPELSLAAYTRALFGLLQAHAQVERRLDGLAADCPPGLPPYRPRLPALQLDVQRLGATATAPPLEPLADAHSREQPPLPATPASYLGVRYVLEGATQGATILSAAVARRLPQLVASGAFNYWELQKTAASDWEALTQHIGAPRDDRELAALTAGAQYAYGCFIDSLSASSGDRAQHARREPLPTAGRRPSHPS
ncbi:biliverdin-producing heme oxygenase [Thiohalocapsa marina]|uniref:biliverdin-producing heme oxygenase n=1 Tax=Thiohalocapsa marina TaxID=424902 RepID=UPI0036D82058